MFQIQYILVAADTDYVKPLTRGSEITYAYTELPCSAEAAALFLLHRVNYVQEGTVPALKGPQSITSF